MKKTNDVFESDNKVQNWLNEYQREIDEIREKGLMKGILREDFNPKDSIIGRDYIDFCGVKFLVSTVDLGIDHSFGGGKPIYWETMIFQKTPNKGELDFNWLGEYQERYTSREDAERKHRFIVEILTDSNIGFLEKKKILLGEENQ